MKHGRFTGLFRLFLFWFLLFIIEKPIFLAALHGLSYSRLTAGDWFDVIMAGLPIDAAIAAYITLAASILVLAAPALGGKRTDTVWKCLLALFSFLTVISTLVNISLYTFWRFPLDITFISSAGCVSLTGCIKSVSEIIILGFAAILLLSYLIFRLAVRTIPLSNDGKTGSTLCLSAILLLIIIFPQDKMKRAWFSDNVLLNHAAINPAYNFFSSIRYNDIASKHYCTMNSDSCTSISNHLICTSSSNTEKVLTTDRPDIYILQLESISSDVWNTEAIPQMKRLADSSIRFTNFYANSFRTDRAMISIMGGFPHTPAPPSIMVESESVNKLHSYSQRLANLGYDLKYYFGCGAGAGSKRRIFVESQGYRMISCEDYPEEEQICAWGVPDECLFTRAVHDFEAEKSEAPRLCLIQMTSSHGPFDVPYHHLEDKVLNSISYVDSCIGSFVDYLRGSGRWDRTLVIVISDHWGIYPSTYVLDDLNKYHVPHFWTGGAVDTSALRKYRNGMPVFSSQQDLAATILGQLDIPHDDILFSKDIFNPDIPQFAFFSAPQIFGIITDSSSVVYSCQAGRILKQSGNNCDSLLVYGKAYIQRICDYINCRLRQ